MYSSPKTVAAFFDFDALWFQPEASWQIKDPNLGQLGAKVSWEQACSCLQQIRKTKSLLKISDYYYFPILDWNTTPLHNSITPPEVLWEVAISHINRRHDLYTISQGNCKELFTLTILSQKPEKSSIVANPFKKAIFVSKALQVNNGKYLSLEDYIEQKITIMLNSLRCTASSYNEITPERYQSPEKIYDQIFLYYTQPEYQGKLTQTLIAKQESLASRRMAIVPSRIAKVER